MSKIINQYVYNESLIVETEDGKWYHLTVLSPSGWNGFEEIQKPVGIN